MAGRWFPLFALILVLVAANGVSAKDGNLCVNGGFEDGLAAWSLMPDGVTPDQGVGRTRQAVRRAAARCECAKEGDQSGVWQLIAFDQKSPLPISLSAWCLTENVSGAKSNHFSLWCDVEYQNDTRPGRAPDVGRVDDWHIVPFDPAKPGWQHIETVFTPEHPIKHIKFYLLFRNKYTGKVWFDDASVRLVSESSVSGAARDFKAIDLRALPADFATRAGSLRDTEALAAVGQRSPVKLFVNGRSRPEGESAGAVLELGGLQEILPLTAAPPYCSIRLRRMWSERNIVVETASLQGGPVEVRLLLPKRIKVRKMLFEDWEVSDDAILLHSLNDRILVKAVLGGANDVDRFIVVFEDEGPEPVGERRRPETLPLATADGLKLELGTDGAIWDLRLGDKSVASERVKRAPLRRGVSEVPRPVHHVHADPSQARRRRLEARDARHVPGGKDSDRALRAEGGKSFLHGLQR